MDTLISLGSLSSLIISVIPVDLITSISLSVNENKMFLEFYQFGSFFSIHFEFY